MADVEHISRGILSLPNEILLDIFSQFPTKTLLTFTLTCRHFHSLILRLLHHRLQIAAGLDGYALYLECGPPAAKWTMSEVFCSSLGTKGVEELLSDVHGDEGCVGRIGRLGELYSRFKPQNTEPDLRAVPRPNRAGDIPGSRTYFEPNSHTASMFTSPNLAVTRTITIDSHFLFSQLETVAYLGRRESTRGLLLSIQVCEGTIRVWRDWLARQCERKTWTDGEQIVVHHEDHGAFQGGGKAGVGGGFSGGCEPSKDPTILWTNTRDDNVGIKFRVKEQKWRRDNPVLFASDVEVPVTYMVELEEVVIRTTHLLLKLEESKKKVGNPMGKAIVFGTFMD